MQVRIIAAQTAYAAVQTTVNAQAAAVKISPSVVAQPDHFSKTVQLVFAASKDGYAPHAPGIKLSFGKHDFDKRQQDAAGTAGYQLYGQKKGIKLSFGKK